MNKKSKEEAQKFCISKNHHIYYKDGDKNIDLNVKNPILYKYKPIEKIGYGSNGITFKVKHSFLEINQVLKIYYKHTDMDKDKKETKKNANVYSQENSYPINDAGYFNIIHSKDTIFSVSNFINNLITLKNWLIENNNSSIESLYLYNFELANAISILGEINNKNKYCVTSGDLNDGNIMVYNNLHKEKDDIVGFAKYNKTMIIDMGTSEASGTTKKEGRKREIKFIFDNFKNIMEPFFHNNKFNLEDILNLKISNECFIVHKKYFYIGDMETFTFECEDECECECEDECECECEINNNKTYYHIKYENLTIELIRLSLFLLIVIGNLHMHKKAHFAMNSENVNNFKDSDEYYLNCVMKENFTNLDLSKLVGANLTSKIQFKDKNDRFKIVNWENLWDILIKNYPGKGLDSYKIIDNERFYKQTK